MASHKPVLVTLEQPETEHLRALHLLYLFLALVAQSAFNMPLFRTWFLAPIICAYHCCCYACKLQVLTGCLTALLPATLLSQLHQLKLSQLFNCQLSHPKVGLLLWLLHN